jgi:hypothetical protein
LVQKEKGFEKVVGLLGARAIGGSIIKGKVLVV